MIRCDKAMKRSKERCKASLETMWKCTHECAHCICGLRKKEDGTWAHNTYNNIKNKGE